MNGILCINKPQGFTSFDVIAKLRGILKIRRMGHAGTLDPMATGVLPVLVGAATRACDRMPDTSKRYRADFVLGIVTDTQDRTGKVLARSDGAVSEQMLRDALSRFVGEIEQIPPMYSAVRVDGKRLYTLARAGKEIERAPRPVTVHALTLCAFDAQSRTGTLDVDCAKGTYIRTLVHDLGQALGVGGVLTALERTRAGVFTLSDCVTLEQVQALADDGAVSSALLPVDRLFQSYPRIRLSEAQSRMFRNGVQLDLSRLREIDADGVHTVYDSDGGFLGLARPVRADNRLKIEKLFCERA